MRNLATVLFVLGTTGIAFAGTTGTLDGTIIDAETNTAVKGGMAVDITCGTVKKTVRTDSAGHFSIAGLPAGACTLSASGGMYVTAMLGVNVTADAIASVLVNTTTRAYAEKIRKQQEERRKAEQEMWKKMERQQVMGRGMGGGPPMPTPAAVEGPMHAPPPRMAPPPMKAPPPPPPGGARPVVAAKIVKLDKNVGAKDHRGERANNNKQLPPPMQPDNNGWSVVRVFPVPDYVKAYDGPRDDFRETIYWNPTVETNANGEADVSFVTSDAVTAFRANAEGFAANGVAATGTATFQSKLPLVLDARLPVEVTQGDRIDLPVSIANETAEAVDVKLAATFGSAFKLGANPAGTIKLAAKSKQTVIFPLEVVATDGTADVSLQINGRGLTDAIEKKIRVVPKGFPVELAASGTAKQQIAHHAFDLTMALPGSIKASATMYPSPVAAMTKGMDAMIREPGGCFEQTSSTNYPNIMILGYLQSNDAADPALIAKSQSVLDKGYKLLTGYETKERGYEWFGSTPGHEALTAYGLMEFADMGKVFDVDKKMVERTADWLMKRRDNKGGFERSTQALDSFGRASPTTTNAYIMWALAEAKRANGMTVELAAQKSLGTDTKDPYLLSLAANTSMLVAPASAESTAMIKKLVGLQGKDGSFPGAKESITMSGGESLAIESTALATLALIKASPKNEYEAQIRSAVEFLNGHKNGYGGWSNTQATILGLKALTAYSEHARQMAAPGKAIIMIDNVASPANTIAFDKGRREALAWNALALPQKKTVIDVKLDSTAQLPYSLAVEYRTTQPPTSPRAKVAVTTELLKPKAKLGEGVKVRVHVENKTAGGIPMTLARIGIPGGTVFQTWQLKELRDKGLIDFYETRPREVVVYWRAMAPNAKKDFDLDLLAQVPGTYEAPASSAYLYYTAEDKTWVKPLAITIEK